MYLEGDLPGLCCDNKSARHCPHLASAWLKAFLGFPQLILILGKSYLFIIPVGLVRVLGRKKGQDLAEASQTTGKAAET